MNNSKCCVVCKKGPDKIADLYLCDCCKNPICQKCSGLTGTEIRVMELKNGRILKFCCKECQTVDNKNDKIVKMEKNILHEIEKLSKNIEGNLHKIIQDELKKMEDMVSTKCEKVIANYFETSSKENYETDKSKTYANVVKQNETNEVIVIMPKDKQESKQTRDELKENIVPKELSIAVENIKNGRNGSVIINCSNKYTKEKITEKVHSALDDKYTVLSVKQKNPKIKIIGVEEEFLKESDELVLDTLKEQNDLDITRESVFQIFSRYSQKNKKNSGIIILTVDPRLKNRIMSINKLNVGWRSCRVQEYFSVIRCFKCARYGHIAAKCENNITCFKCAGMHKTEECSEKTLKCVNCTEANSKLKKTLNSNHAATDHNCPCYQRVLNIETKKTKNE